MQRTFVTSDSPAGSERTPVLSVRDLRVRITGRRETGTIIDGVSFDLGRGETLGIVGESGCGKSMTVMSLLGLVPPKTVQVSGQALLYDRDLLVLSERERRRIRGRQVGMIFQEPMTSLNPVFTLGDQIAEAIRIHNRKISRSAAWKRAADLLASVGVGNAGARIRQYPHEFSGGLRQRAMIAMAIANDPDVLIADEPTTALDVTVQAQVMDVLREAQQRTGAATILITHDIGLVAEIADRIAVMYAGTIAEVGNTRDILTTPRHPYTRRLLTSLPSLDTAGEPLQVIPGEPPDPRQTPAGCPFTPRCWLSNGREECQSSRPPLLPTDQSEHHAACHFRHETTGAPL